MTRLVLVLACALLFLLALAGMRLGWRNRGRRQAGLPPLPQAPDLDGPELAPALTGLDVGSTAAARLEPALAGTAVGNGGLLVLRWRHGGQLLDSGLRAEDKAGYPAWIEAVGTLAELSGPRPEQAAS